MKEAWTKLRSRPIRRWGEAPLVARSILLTLWALAWWLAIAWMLKVWFDQPISRLSQRVEQWEQALDEQRVSQEQQSQAQVQWQSLNEALVAKEYAIGGLPDLSSWRRVAEQTARQLSLELIWVEPDAVAHAPDLDSNWLDRWHESGGQSRNQSVRIKGSWPSVAQWWDGWVTSQRSGLTWPLAVLITPHISTQELTLEARVLWLGWGQTLVKSPEENLSQPIASHTNQTEVGALFGLGLQTPHVWQALDLSYLQLVGIGQQEGESVAWIEDPNRYIHRLSPGDHLVRGRFQVHAIDHAGLDLRDVNNERSLRWDGP